MNLASTKPSLTVAPDPDAIGFTSMPCDVCSQCRADSKEPDEMNRLHSLSALWKQALVALALALFGLNGTASAQGQDWPSKPVRLIVPFGAGTTDVLARLFAKSIGEATRQTFVVENKTGAGGSIGASEVVRSAPDGHTLLIATASTHAVAPHLAKLPYDTVGDFSPIFHIGDTDLIILVSPHLGVTTVAEFIKRAREKPGTINYASNGVGTIGHLAIELLAQQTGIVLNHIPYKGSGLAIPDLASGLIQLSTDVPATGSSHISSGRVKGLAVTGGRRSTLLPNVETVAETVPNFSAVTWFGLYGPKGMVPELTRRIHTAFRTAMQAPEIAERFKAMGIDAGRGSPEDFAAMVAKDSARWGRVIKDRNIKTE